MTTPALPRATLRRPLSSRAVHALFVWVLGLAALLVVPALPTFRLGAVAPVSSLSSIALVQVGDEEEEPVAAEEEERDEVEDSYLTDVLPVSIASLSARREQSAGRIWRRPLDSLAPPTVDLDPCRKPPGLAIVLG